MSFKIDASKFKKIGGDDKHAVLRHKDGHELKIALSGLSPKIRSQVAEIPHFDGGGYLEGSDRLKAGPSTYDASKPEKIHNPPAPQHEESAPEYKGQGHDYTGHEDEDMMAHGGSVKSQAKRNHELKGINVGTVASDGKQSHAGAILEKTGDSTLPKMKAKQVLDEMKSMPKPKLMAEGGVCTNCPCPSCAKAKMADGGPVALPQTADEVTTAQDHGQPGTDLSFQDAEGTQMQGQQQQPAPQQAMDPESPAQAADSPDRAPAGGANYNSAQGSDPAAPDSNMPEYNQATRSGAGDGDGYEALKQKYLHEHLQEDAAFVHDLKNGHITPETYGSLFAKKDTLGKIGTIFGLLMSGFGSGLSGQPNALLHMMDQTISNDLDAQKQSKANAQNFLRLNQQHELNKAQIKYQGQQGKLTEAQTKSALIDAEVKTRAMHNRAAMDALARASDKITDPAQKAIASQVLGMMAGAVNNDNYSSYTRASAMKALLNSNNAGGGNNPDAGFQQQQFARRASGDPNQAALAMDAESKHFPGVHGRASAPLAGNEKEYLNSGITFHKQLQDFMDWTKNHSGDLNPADRREGEARAAELQGAYRQATHGGVYKEGEQNFIGKLINDEPTKFFNKIRVMPQLKAINDTTQKRMDQYSKNLGFQGYSGPSGSPNQPPAAAQPQYKVDAKGQKWMRGPNGKGVKVQ